MRYFAELAYNGMNYCGWQKQPNEASVQETIEQALSTILRQPIEIVGCGRTDAGVHASQYFIHFDVESALPEGLMHRLNKFLPDNIAIYQFIAIHHDAHARYDAFHRKYGYYVNTQKNPFSLETAYHFPFGAQLNFQKMQMAAELLLDYEAFAPFCKTNTDTKTMNCHIIQSEWEWIESNKKLVYHIAANRFLRGMVRLIVGMCLNVGLNRISIETVKQSLDTQQPLAKSWSVPPQGLFLEEIKYPYIQTKII